MGAPSDAGGVARCGATAVARRRAKPAKRPLGNVSRYARYSAGLLLCAIDCHIAKSAASWARAGGARSTRARPMTAPAGYEITRPPDHGCLSGAGRDVAFLAHSRATPAD